MTMESRQHERVASRTRLPVALSLFLSLSVIAGSLIGCDMSPATDTSQRHDAVGSARQAPAPQATELSRAGDWQSYANADGDSGVGAYLIGPDFVGVRFRDQSVYVYTYASAGEANIERMKNLARDGEGLNAFINSNVRYRYASKHR